VTVRELMGQTAGIMADGGGDGPLFTKHCEGPVSAVPHFAEKSLPFEPGTQYRYSEYGWVLVSAAIEAAAERDDGHPIVNQILERVYDPRTTRRTMPDPAKGPMAERVTSYFPRWSSDPNYGLCVMRPLDRSCYAGPAVFRSAPSDLVGFGMAIIGGKLLQPATVQMLQRPRRLASGTGTGYGLGWESETVTLAGEPTRMAGQSGKLLGGVMTSLMTFSDHGIVVSVIWNVSNADTQSIAVRIAEAFAGRGRGTAGR
jgi:serine beta-lactamase-like protein LACTB, mitochondrial